MERKKELVCRLQEVLLDGYWIANTNYKAQLQNLSWEQATYQIDTINTIALLVFHVNYYLDGITRFFRNGNLDISDSYSFNAPSITSAADWEILLQEFIANSEAFIQEVQNLPDSKLDEIFVRKEYGTYLRNIEGVIEHSYYHLGQIVLIRKLLPKNISTG
jgi:uncharacterized damage-inducible protein DinB